MVRDELGVMEDVPRYTTGNAVTHEMRSVFYVACTVGMYLVFSKRTNKVFHRNCHFGQGHVMVAADTERRRDRLA